MITKNKDGREVNAKHMLSIYWIRTNESRKLGPTQGRVTQSSDDLEELQATEAEIREEFESQSNDRVIKSVAYYTRTDNLDRVLADMGL